MNKKKNFSRILSFLPLLLMLSVIFSFSAQTGEQSGSLSFSVAQKIVEIKDRLFSRAESAEQILQEAEKIHFYVRKAGHMGEYFLLALTVYLPLSVYGQKGISRFLWALGVSVLFAGLDEFHQSFVAGRGPSAADVGIDSCGALLALLLAEGIGFLHRRYRKKV